MSLRNLALIALLLLASSLPVVAAESAGGHPAAAIEMSPAEGPDAAQAGGAAVPEEAVKEDASYPGRAAAAGREAHAAGKDAPAARDDRDAGEERDVKEPNEADRKLADAAKEKAKESSAKPASAAAPASSNPAGQESPSFLRRLAYTVGLASDPAPGVTAADGMPNPPISRDYLIGPGDLLGISVWRDDNLTRTLVVLPDGRISFPLVGEVVASGKTVAQLKAEMEKKLTRFVSDAQLTVEVKQSNSMIIYVIGKVNTPGRQVLLASTNVMQALAMAGGLNAFAKGRLKIYRQEDGKTVVYPFDYDDVAEGKHLESNIELKRGDVILVP